MKDWQLVGLITVLAMAIGGGGMAFYSKVRGLRNNNPGNIKKSGDQWKGLADDQSDPVFFRFVSPEWGIRAIHKTLNTYENRYGINTVATIIERWAPDVENKTAAYIDHVADQLGVYWSQELGPEHRLPLIKAIIKHENGIQPYSDRFILDAMELA